MGASFLLSCYMFKFYSHLYFFIFVLFPLIHLRMYTYISYFAIKFSAISSPLIPSLSQWQFSLTTSCTSFLNSLNPFCISYVFMVVGCRTVNDAWTVDTQEAHSSRKLSVSSPPAILSTDKPFFNRVCSSLFYSPLMLVLWLNYSVKDLPWSHNWHEYIYKMVLPW